MTLYRIDIEKRVVWDGSTSGFYYWTNSYHFLATDLLHREEAIENIKDADWSFIMDSVYRTAFKCFELPSNTLVASFHDYQLPHIPYLPGTWLSLTNTLYVGGEYDDGSRFFKRYRLPCRVEDMAGDGRLSSATYDFLAPKAENLPSLGVLASGSGSPLVRSWLSPLVHDWQWRDGTKRRSRSVLFP